MRGFRFLPGCAFGLVCALAAAAADAPKTAGYGWPDITDFLKRLVAETGPPIKVYKLTMDSDGKADLWIQQQARRDLVDSYEYDHGTMNGPIPVKFDHYPSVAALDHHVIELTTIDFQRLPGMLDSARTKTSLPDARVVRIELERGDSHGALTYSDIPIWTFYIDTPRHDARVEFDLGGKVLNVDKD